MRVGFGRGATFLSPARRSLSFREPVPLNRKLEKSLPAPLPLPSLGGTE